MNGNANNSNTKPTRINANYKNNGGSINRKDSTSIKSTVEKNDIYTGEEETGLLIEPNNNDMGDSPTELLIETPVI